MYLANNQVCFTERRSKIKITNETPLGGLIFFSVAIKITKRAMLWAAAKIDKTVYI